MPTLGEDFIDMITKLQQNRLTPADTGNFAAKLDRVEQTFTPLQKWVSPSGLSVPSITAQTAYFQQQPMGLLTLKITEPGGIMALATGVKSYLSFSSVVSSSGAMFRWDSADPTKIYIQDSVNRDIVISGQVKFESNGTGDRSLSVETFNGSDVQIDGASIFRLPAANNDDTICSFVRHWQLSNTGERYIKLGVTQDSGIEIDLETARIGFWVLR